MDNGIVSATEHVYTASHNERVLMNAHRIIITKDACSHKPLSSI